MADSSNRSDDAAWDALDQAFFASAPPDVPEAPAEPERFDDLFPAAAATPRRRARATEPDGAGAPGRASATVAASRAFVRRASGAIGRGARPALASVGRLTAASWRASARAIGAAGRATSRTARAAIPVAARLVGAIRVSRLNGRAIAIMVASMVLVTGLSAVVVASRGNGHANLPATPLESRASAAHATVAAAVPPPATSPLAPEPEPAQMQSVVPDPEPAAPEPEPPARSRAAPAAAASSQGSPESGEPRHRQAEPAKHAAAPAAPRHRRASYSAEKDLMLPSFMQEQPQASKPARPQATPASAAPTREPAPAYRPAPPASPAYAPAPPAPPARPLFSR